MKDEDEDEEKGRCRSCLARMVVVLSPGPADRCCEMLEELCVPGTNNENREKKIMQKSSFLLTHTDTLQHWQTNEKATGLGDKGKKKRVGRR